MHKNKSNQGENLYKEFKIIALQLLTNKYYGPGRKII